MTGGKFPRNDGKKVPRNDENNVIARETQATAAIYIQMIQMSRLLRHCVPRNDGRKVPRNDGRKVPRNDERKVPRNDEEGSSG